MYRFVWKITLYDKSPEGQTAFLKHWREASMVLQEYDGARGTYAHQTRNEEGSFFLIAQWESQEARDIMQADIDAGISERAKRWSVFPDNSTFGTHDAVFAGKELDIVTPE